MGGCFLLIEAPYLGGLFGTKLFLPGPRKIIGGNYMGGLPPCKSLFEALKKHLKLGCRFKEYVSATSHCRTIHASLGYHSLHFQLFVGEYQAPLFAGKLAKPRQLHNNTQWGMLCLAETPEGHACGLVKVWSCGPVH